MIPAGPQAQQQQQPAAAAVSTEGAAPPAPTTTMRKKTTGPLHNPRYKSTMCQHFANTGACPYSEKCQFAHGPEELAKWQQNRVVQQQHTAMQQLLAEQALSMQRMQQQQLQFQQQQQHQRFMYAPVPSQPQQQQQFDYYGQEFGRAMGNNQFEEYNAQQPQRRFSPRGGGANEMGVNYAHQQQQQQHSAALSLESGGTHSTPLYQKKASQLDFHNTEPRNLFSRQQSAPSPRESQQQQQQQPGKSGGGSGSLFVGADDSSRVEDDIFLSSSFRRNQSLPQMYSNNYRASSSMTNIFEPPPALVPPYSAPPSQQQQHPLQDSPHYFEHFPQPRNLADQFSSMSLLGGSSGGVAQRHSRNRRGSAPPVVLSEAVSLADFTELDHLADAMVSEQGKEMVLNSTPASAQARNSQLFNMSTVFPSSAFPSSINDCL